MDSFLIQLLLVAALAVVGWHAAKYGIKILGYALGLCAVVMFIAPGAYGAAKAEKALPSRDLSFDYEGNTKDAALFNTIVKDRLRRTNIAARRPDITWTATNFGRRFAA